MPQNYKTILIAYDHSNAAQIAARKAVEIGRKFNSVFQTVFVIFRTLKLNFRFP